MTSTRAVIDASALVKLVLPDPLNSAAHRIAAHYSLIAPGLILTECANVLWKAVRFASYSEDSARSALAILNAAVATEPDNTLIPEAFEASLRLAHPVYDCLYVALAMREDVPFISADKKLVKKLRASIKSLVCLDLHELPKKLP